MDSSRNLFLQAKTQFDNSKQCGSCGMTLHTSNYRKNIKSEKTSPLTGKKT